MRISLIKDALAYAIQTSHDGGRTWQTDPTWTPFQVGDGFDTGSQALSYAFMNGDMAARGADGARLLVLRPGFDPADLQAHAAGAYWVKVPTGRDHMVTPDTDPDRFTAEEAELFRAGKCSHQTEYGNGGGPRYCGQASEPGASFGHCPEHAADLAELYHPDGSPRY